MLTLARRAANLELQLQAHAWLVVDLLELGDADAVDAQIAAFTAGAEQLRQPLYLWQASVWRAMRALLQGSLAQAEELAAEALAAGGPAEGVTATQYYAIQLLAIRREQGRLGELEQAARQMVASNPIRPAWRAALATMLWESDRLEEAREELEQLAREDFRDVPRDGDWMTTVIVLCEIVAALEDRERSALLYEALLPYESVHVAAGIAVVCFGSAARYLGKLAFTIGRQDDATRHFELALEHNAMLEAPVLLAHTRLDFAAALGGGIRSRRMIDEAAEAAAELGLPAVARRVERLRAG
jgi:tetratricopeptide (TPR) repeat protein